MTIYQEKLVSAEAPKPFTDQEAWIVDNCVIGIKTSWEFTGVDTSQEFVTLTNWDGKSVTWKMENFRKIAKISHHISSTSSLIEPQEYKLRERIEARRAWEKKEAKDLAEFKRLQAKFGPVDATVTKA